MSIHDEINAKCAEKRLFHLPSLFLGEEVPRSVFVSVEVAGLVCHTPAKGRDGRLAANARGVLDAFSEGGRITVGEDPFDKDVKCIMGRVDPVELEIFDFRCLDPNPGLRILGAFSECDTFIALTWDYRENFDDQWPDQIARCEAEWNALFESPRHSGKTVYDYISFNVRSV